MKTVICDNSLSTQKINYGITPELIYKYITALGDLGVTYVEIDHNIALKMPELPDNVKYIYRVSDPMFMAVMDMFDFDYVLLTPDTLDPKHIPSCPVIFELEGYSASDKMTLNLANSVLKRKISLVQFNSCFGLRCNIAGRQLDMLKQEDVTKFVRTLKNMITVPISFCAHDNSRNALDFSMKAINARVDMITFGLGACEEYAALDEYLFRKMVFTHDDRAVMEKICKAAFLHKIIFDTPKDLFMSILKQIDVDIYQLRNVDTGEHIGSGISLAESATLGYLHTSVLEQFIEEEDIPEDFAQDIRAAIERYDAALYNAQKQVKKGILN